MDQSIRFCTTDDGVRIAYATSGKGSPIVRPGHWLTHLEFDLKSPVWIEENSFQFPENQIVASPLVGVDYAGEHAEWHYRFYINGSKYVSGKKLIQKTFTTK